MPNYPILCPKDPINSNQAYSNKNHLSYKVHLVSSPLIDINLIFYYPDIN
jgi:hypothetical protein